MGAVSRIHIGTSGWHYDSWADVFYSPGTKSADRLAQYVKTFATVELNNSFYSLPEKATVEQWLNTVPDDFIFSCKANRYITHMKKLKDPHESVSRSFEAVAPFKDKLGPILFQLPPNWRVNVQRLSEFLVALPKAYRYTFEFRDKSWLCEDVYNVLKHHNASLCFYDYKRFCSPEVITADFIYLRLHGPNEAAYAGSYDAQRLHDYAEKFLKWANQVQDIYCYFDNDSEGCAPSDAQTLMESVKNADDT